MQVEPYLNFNGRCEEAIEFYKSKLGAKVEMLMKFKDSPQQCPEGTLLPGSENKVMHSSLRIGNSILMATDGQCPGGEKESFKGFSLSLSAADNASAEKLFAALSEGGKITMPMGETFFASRFGMVADKFGVHWMVIVQKKF